MIKDKSNLDFKYVDDMYRAANLGVAVNTVGFQQIEPNSLYPPECHPAGYYFNSKSGRKLSEFQLVYVTQGAGTLQIETEKYTVQKGDIFIIHPNQWHTYAPDNNTGWNEYYIGFKGDIVYKWIDSSLLGSNTQLYSIGLNEELVQLFKRAIELAKFSNQVFDLHLSGIIYHLLGLLIFEINNKELLSEYNMQLVEKSKVIMNENIESSLNIEELSANLNLNYTTFRKNFKLTTGFSPKQYFIELKLKKAKQLLLETSFSVKEIAAKLGFSSSEHFTITFKQKMGSTPQGYRKLCRPS
ncbi:MAG: AraC family transcriptional regulator [Paludibacter sp.]